jgi:hypothetical protein
MTHGALAQKTPRHLHDGEEANGIMGLFVEEWDGFKQKNLKKMPGRPQAEVAESSKVIRQASARAGQDLSK